MVAGDEEDGEQRQLQGSRGTGWLHQREAEALEGSPWPGRGWSYRDDPRGSPASSSSGTVARGLPGRATAIYTLVECVGVEDGARGGWGGLYL